MRATDIPKVTHTLLLADDSVTIQRVIELTFADEDVQVVAVGDGDQAIARLESSPPDIVLADIGMPGRNGYEVAHYVKQSPRLAHIPVVLLTGAFEPVDQARASEAGCDGVLAKPFEPQLVISRVKDLLGRPRQTADVADRISPAEPTVAARSATAPPADRWSPAPIAEMFAPRPPSAAPPVPAADATVGQASEPSAPTPLDSYFDRLDAAFSMFSSNPAPDAPQEAPPAPAAPRDEIDWFGALKHDAVARAPELNLPSTPPAPAEMPDFPLSVFAPAPTEAQDVSRDAAPLTASAAAIEDAAVVECAPAEEILVSVEAVPVVEAAAQAVEAVTPIAEVATPVAEVVEAVDPAPIATLAAALDAPPETIAQPPLAEERWKAAAAAPVAHVAPPPFHALPSLGDAFAALLAAEKAEGVPPMAPAWPSSGAASGPSSALAQNEMVEQVTRRVLDHLSDRVVRDTVAELVSAIAERLVREEIERIKSAIK
jgi:CheY-like chemotaxis protein